MRHQRAAATRTPRSRRDASTRADRAATRSCDELRDGEKFLLVTHENPDGDALGSLVAMHEILARARQGHRDVHVRRGVPAALRVPLSSPLDGPRHALPADVDERTIVFLDCGNIDRNPADVLRRRDDGAHRQHRPPPRQHALRHRRTCVVDGASCTAEIVWDLMRDLGVEPTPTIAEALYVGLVTDTGKFMYENTGAARARDGRRADRRRGRRPRASTGALYEDVPFAKLELLARGAAPRRALRRRPAARSLVLRADYEETGAEENYSEGIVDHLRARRGHGGRGARARAARGRPRRRAKVTLRASDDAVDVSRDRPRAGRRRPPPGGRLLDRRAAATSSSSSCAARSPRSSERATSAVDGVLLIDKPAGMTSHDVVAPVRRALARAPKVGHAGTLDPFATGLLLVLVGRATRVQRFLMALPKTYEVVARLGATSTTGDPEGEIVRDRRRLPDALELPTGEVAPAPAGLHGGEGRRRARLRARAQGRGRRAAERDGHASTASSSSGARATAPRFEIECSAGTYVRSLVADLGDAYCEELRRTAIGPFAVERRRLRRAAASPLADALAFLPERRLDGEAGARRRRTGVAVAGPRRRGRCGCVDDDGPIAIAEPRDGGLLKPVVGFRA